MVIVLVMTTSDPDSEMEYRKVIVNIPKTLLDTFDLVCQMKFYTRKEAVKQAMREFIQTEMGEDWQSPLMQEYENKLVTNAMESVVVGMAKGAQSPEVQKAQQLQNQQLQNRSQSNKK